MLSKPLRASLKLLFVQRSHSKANMTAHDFGSFATWALQAILAGAVVYAVTILSRLQTSVEQLNSQIAVIIEKTSWHERELERHDDRISQIENYRRENV